MEEFKKLLVIWVVISWCFY